MRSMRLQGRSDVVGPENESGVRELIMEIRPGDKQRKLLKAAMKGYEETDQTCCEDKARAPLCLSQQMGWVCESPACHAE